MGTKQENLNQTSKDQLNEARKTERGSRAGTFTTHSVQAAGTEEALCLRRELGEKQELDF